MSIADINLFMFNTERNDMTIESNKKFKIKYTKQNGEEVRRFGIITDKCRGLGKRIKDLKPFLHYYDLEKKGYRYATNWEIL
jgi:hypothetical protein|tara:strand:- start:138 stop:383 length:246 start_codon:yes stop_codon:yes gene_type:complete